jgi:hypothetical protein
MFWCRCGLPLILLLLPPRTGTPRGLAASSPAATSFPSSAAFLLPGFSLLAEGAPQKKRRRSKNNPNPNGGGGGSSGANRKSGLVCDSTMGHRFNPVAPVHKARHNKMSFCSKYRRNTCCNKTHTDAILRKDRVVAAAKLNAECRRVSETVHCAPCDPAVGTGRVKRICTPLCDAWLRACGKEFYSAPNNVGGALMPCLDNMLVCSQLDTIVADGAAFCRAMGFEPEAAAAAANGDEEDEGDEDDEEGSRGKGQCFDGRVSNTNGVFEAEKDTPGDLNDLFKRYRKSQAGKAASSLARALDTIPTWVLLVFTLLAGAFIALRVFVLTNKRGRRLGGGGGDGLSRFQNMGAGKKGKRVQDDFDDDSDGDEFFDAPSSGNGESNKEAGPTANNNNNNNNINDDAVKAFPKVDAW